MRIEDLADDFVSRYADMEAYKAIPLERLPAFRSVLRRLFVCVLEDILDDAACELRQQRNLALDANLDLEDLWEFIETSDYWLNVLHACLEDTFISLSSEYQSGIIH